MATTTRTCLLFLATAAPALAQDAAVEEEPAVAVELLQAYCYDCHGYGGEEGGVALDRLVEEWNAPSHSPEARADLRERWGRVLRLVRADVMPPADSDQPTDEQKERLAEWVKREPFGLDPQNPDPGRPTLRRLNRVEYRNTVRDLTGVDFDTRVAFPADDTGHGFDNLGDVLTISPLHLEKYLAAAREIVEQAVPAAGRVPAEKRLDGGAFTPPDGEPHGGWHALTYYEPNEASATHAVEIAGRYEVVANYRADERHVEGQFDLNKCRLRFSVDGQSMIDQELSRGNGRKFEHRATFSWDAGDHDLRFEVEPAGEAEEQIRDLRVNLVSVTVRGPLEDEHWIRPKGYRKWFPRDPPDDPEGRRAYARELLERFATRAFRRPAPAPTVDALVEIAMSAVEGGATFETGVGRAMTAVLASPRFLFREEGEIAAADSPAEPHPLVDEHTLASRLSYLFWSTAPDAELTRLADAGELRNQLPEQFDRLLDDRRSKRFVENFVGQWLQARSLQTIRVLAEEVLPRDHMPESELEDKKRQFRRLRRKRPEQRTEEDKQELRRLWREYQSIVDKYREYELNGRLKHAMRRETEMAFDHVLRTDASVLDLLDCDYTFLNERLAKHYGIDGVEGDEMRLVELPESSPRGGLLTQGTVLVTTSNPNRTSPVKRGVYLLDNVIGSPPPPPPPNIPPLEDTEESSDLEGLTLRRSLELHRESPECAGCHARMDPLGLALESFNALGLHRETDRGAEVDPSGTLVSGESFSNASELKRVLRGERRLDFYRCLTEKLLTYALGRGMEYYDTPTIDSLVDNLEASGGDLRGLLRGVVDSAPFQRRRTVASPESAVTDFQAGGQTDGQTNASKERG